MQILENKQLLKIFGTLDPVEKKSKNNNYKE